MFKIRITVSKSIFGRDSTNIAKIKFKKIYWCLNCFEIERFVQLTLWLTNKQSQLLDPSLLFYLDQEFSSEETLPLFTPFQAYWCPLSKVMWYVSIFWRKEDTIMWNCVKLLFSSFHFSCNISARDPQPWAN